MTQKTRLQSVNGFKWRPLGAPSYRRERVHYSVPWFLYCVFSLGVIIGGFWLVRVPCVRSKD